MRHWALGENVGRQVQVGQASKIRLSSIDQQSGEALEVLVGGSDGDGKAWMGRTSSYQQIEVTDQVKTHMSCGSIKLKS